MAVHVDVMRHNWLTGWRYRLASIGLDATGGVVLTAGRRERWQALVDELAVSSDPAGALAELHRRLDGSQVFATEAHDERDCPYAREVCLSAGEAG